jgi:hypothetical protein
MKKVRNNKVENENRKENETKPKPNDLKKKRRSDLCSKYSPFTDLPPPECFLA